MSSGSVTSGGRRAAFVSLGLGLLGIVFWFALLRIPALHQVKLASWLLIGAFLAPGLIGVIAGVVGTMRGRGLTRLVAVVGFLLGLLNTLTGVAVALFSLISFNSIFT